MYSVAVSLTSHDSMIDSSKITRVRRPLPGVPTGRDRAYRPRSGSPGEAVSRFTAILPDLNQRLHHLQVERQSLLHRWKLAGSYPFGQHLGDSWNLEVGASSGFLFLLLFFNDRGFLFFLPLPRLRRGLPLPPRQQGQPPQWAGRWSQALRRPINWTFNHLRLRMSDSSYVKINRSPRFWGAAEFRMVFSLPSFHSGCRINRGSRDRIALAQHLPKHARLAVWRA